MRFVIPFAVLYTIGYYVPGFSALTVPWIIMLALLIMAGDWLIERVFPGDAFGRFQEGIMNFLVSAVIIFTVTLALKDGKVPFSGSLLAALLIGVLLALVPNEEWIAERKERDKKSRP
jgi:uncharacterized membrane protein YhhN